MKYRILVGQGRDPALEEGSLSFLCQQGFEVTVYFGQAEVLAMLAGTAPDLIILGGWPGNELLTICQDVRMVSKVPIMVLGSMPEDDGWISSVAAGADLYLARPVSNQKLVARVRAVLRREKWSQDKSRLGKIRGRNEKRVIEAVDCPLNLICYSSCFWYRENRCEYPERI